MAHPTPSRRRFSLQKADWDGYSTELNNLLKTLNPSQNTMVGSWTSYVWLQEGISHEDVEQTICANQVAHQLLINSRGTMSNKPKRPVLSPTAEESMVYPFSEEGYRRGIATLKNNKAAGIDDVLDEQLKNLGPKTHKWLLAMLNNCFTHNRIPTIWRKSKIITTRTNYTND